MNSLEFKKRKEFKKTLKGMKERFRTVSEQNFNNALALFLKELYYAYNANEDFFNTALLKAYAEINDLFQARLKNGRDPLKDQIKIASFVLEATMREFRSQAASLYK